ncbi:type VII toxin-antitoxin system HepT family RNase toxin [Candidatus Entotheonella palauensis]|nr:HepT-like ribonuclease domain-containing protein [Candidatus Entotheonella palauensis]
MISLQSHPEEVQRLSIIGAELHARFPELLALFLFGSTARGNANTTSDIDLAIFTDPRKEITACSPLSSYAVITSLLRTDRVDLLWLNQAPLLLQWEVVRTGILLFTSDAIAVAEFVEKVAREARDASTYARLCQTWYRTFLTQTYRDKRKGPMIDVRRILEKIDYIRNTAKPVLAQLAELDTGPFVNDPIVLGAAKYYLQSAVEAMLDMANHIMARRGFGTFETHAKTFDILTDHGLLRREYLDTYKQMIGLRNRLVHVYDDIDPAILHRILVQDLDDFDRFIEDVTALLEQEPGG